MAPEWAPPGETNATRQTAPTPTPTPAPAPAPAAPKAMPTLTASLAPAAAPASKIPKPLLLTYAAAAAPAPPEPAAAEPAVKVAGGAGQQKVKTPVAELAGLPVAPLSVVSLTVMVKDFEKVIAGHQKPGAKSGDKISKEDVNMLKKYNDYLDTKVTGGTTIKALTEKLKDLRIQLGLKNMSPTATTTSQTAVQEKH